MMVYQAYILIQSLLYYVISQIDPLMGLINVLQAVTAIIVFLIGWFLNKKRKGFDFVPDSLNYRIKLKQHEKIILTLMIPTVALLMLTLHAMQNSPDWYILIPIIYALVFFLYIHYSYRKDRTE
ncbi:hypothetical protein [Paenibacillus yanchengensis]|uniref:Uncharacterized protein n=1 Tax=Paenibacillus yanchengensis TaxID=2035833 RepID=A0ABW4YG61_9BACL